MGIAELCKWHGPGVVPGVNHLRDPTHRAATACAAALTRKCNVVDEWTMRIQCRKVRSSSLAKLLERSDGNERVTRVAAPERKRCAPVSLSRQRPIDIVGQPVPIAAVPDVRWAPVDYPVL